MTPPSTDPFHGEDLPGMSRRDATLLGTRGDGAGRIGLYPGCHE